MSLVIEVDHSAGEFRLDVRARLGGGLTALVGPSGSGKTTLLNVIAGLTRPGRAISGRGSDAVTNRAGGAVIKRDGAVVMNRDGAAVINLHNIVLADTRAGVWVPPYRRRIGYVFQEPRLFPHLTVRQNLLYGRWFTRQWPGSIAPDAVIRLLDLDRLLQRSPARLSGGEQQRVALGRALLGRPRLLLLDEPLSSIDQQHRLEILPFLDRIRADHSIPTIYVTHVWAEVEGRADDVIELAAGHVVFAGRAADR